MMITYCKLFIEMLPCLDNDSFFLSLRQAQIEQLKVFEMIQTELIQSS